MPRLLPNRKLLVPVEATDPEDGIALREVGPDHPGYGRWLADAEPGEAPSAISPVPFTFSIRTCAIPPPPFSLACGGCPARIDARSPLA